MSKNCFYCGRILIPRTKQDIFNPDDADYTRDHVYPLNFIDSLEPKHRAILPANFMILNIVDCCRKENNLKGHLHPLDWLVIMPNDVGAKRLADRITKMGADVDDVASALKRRKS